MDVAGANAQGRTFHKAFFSSWDNCSKLLETPLVRDEAFVEITGAIPGKRAKALAVFTKSSWAMRLRQRLLEAPPPSPDGIVANRTSSSATRTHNGASGWRSQ